MPSFTDVTTSGVREEHVLIVILRSPFFFCSDEIPDELDGIDNGRPRQGQNDVASVRCFIRCCMLCKRFAYVTTYMHLDAAKENMMEQDDTGDIDLTERWRR